MQENLPTVTTTLQDVWDSLDPPLGGITGQSAAEGNEILTPSITATIFMASQGKCLHTNWCHRSLWNFCLGISGRISAEEMGKNDDGQNIIIKLYSYSRRQ